MKKIALFFFFFCWIGCIPLLQSQVNVNKWNGTSYELPYHCSFTNADMSFWKIIDRNKDGKTWERTMIDKGVRCLYSSLPGDDWLISSPILLKKGVKYKINVVASSYDEYTPEKMSLHIGKGNTEDVLNTDFFRIAEYEVTNTEGGRNSYKAYFKTDDFTLPPSDSYNIAIRMYSDPDMYQLEVHSIDIAEAGEGILYGQVLHKNNAVYGAVVRIKGTDFSVQTDSEGRWRLTNIPEAVYSLEIVKEGFAMFVKEVEVKTEIETEVVCELNSLEKLNIGGKVTYGNNTPLNGATVTLTPTTNISTPSKYIVSSNEAGEYSFANIYEGEYVLNVSRQGLYPFADTLILDKNISNISVIELKDKAVAPRLVEVAPYHTGNIVTWSEPIDASSLYYYKGEGIARIGIFSYTPNSIVGSVFRRDMALTKVSWQTDEYRGPHKLVDLVVFALDANGEPTNNIIYEKTGINNIDNEWSSYELPEPICIKGGALIALRYNGYLSLRADGGTIMGLPFTPNVHVINNDYTSSPFEYLDNHDMKKNLLIQIEHTPLNAENKLPNTLHRHTSYEVFRRAETNGNIAEWQLIGTTTNEVRSFSDDQWGNLPMGYYRYAVKSVVSDTEKSLFAVSQIVGKDLDTQVTFNITTNAGNHSADTEIMLEDVSDSKKIYKASNDNNKWTVRLPKGIYKLTALLDGFENIETDSIRFDKQNEYQYDLMFKERLLAAYNLKAIPTDKPSEMTLSWNSDNYIFDGFEEYPAFTTEPATPTKNWIYWDLDKALTVEFEGLTFKHSGEAMSYLVFNPYETNPNMAFLDNASIPYDGKQYLASFGNRTTDNQDYIFSPILKFDGKATLRFMVRSFSNQLGNELINIGYTKTEYPKTSADITWINQSVKISDKDWQLIEITIPKEASRMVIAHVSQKSIFLMIDNLFVGEECPYADGSIKKPLIDRAKYEVKLDGEVISDNSTEKTLTLSNLKHGIHTVEVTAVYVSGRAETKKLDIEVSQISSITDINIEDKTYFYPNPAKTYINLDEEVVRWQLLDFGGRIIDKGAEQIINVSKIPIGIYYLKLYLNNGNSLIKKIVVQ